MAPRAKGKTTATGNHDVLKEDTNSDQSRHSDVDQPHTAMQSQFMTPTASEYPTRVLSPSISSWGYQGGGGTYDYSPTRTTGGKSQYIPFGSQMNQPDISSPLPQQLTRPTFISPPEEVTTENVATKGNEEAKSSKTTNKTGLPTLTKGSTSKTISSGTGLKEDESWIEQVPVEELVAIQGPLLDLPQKSEYYSSIYVKFYALKPLHMMANDPTYGVALSDRWVKALKIGGAYLSKEYKANLKQGSRQLSPEDRLILKDILEPLDELLKKIDKYSDKRVMGFKLNKKRLVEFMHRLIKLRLEAEDDLIMQGNGLPTIPHWGLEGNANLFWKANDFKILGACYCEEVMQFCIQIMEAINANKLQGETIADILPKVQTSASSNQRKQLPMQESKKGIPMFDDAPISLSMRVQSFTNQNTSIFGNPSRNTASKKLANLLRNKPAFIGSAPDPNDPDDDDDGEGQDNRGGRPPPRNPNGPPGRSPNEPPKGPSKSNGRCQPGGPSGGAPGGPPSGKPPNDPSSNGGGRSNKPAIPQFDSKLKVDVIPTWDGNTDDLGQWLIKINRLSERSEIVFKQLGYLVPTRLTGAAELWYYSQNSEVRSRIEEDWGSLRNAIAGYYMNRSYLERQQTRANKARYRQQGHFTESPSEYFIRKLELLEIVYNYSEGELINKIMAGTPSYWSTILAPHLYDSIEGFQMAIKFQEDNLLRVGVETTRNRQEIYGHQESRNPFVKIQSTPAARVNAVGWNKNLSNPPFPKDDSNVSP